MVADVLGLLFEQTELLAELAQGLVMGQGRFAGAPVVPESGNQGPFDRVS
jgi:hypothetical protein